MARKKTDWKSLLAWAQSKGYIRYLKKERRWQIVGSNRTINEKQARRTASYLKKYGPAATYEIYGQNKAMEQRSREIQRRKGPRTAIVVKKGKVPLLKRLRMKAQQINKRRKGYVPEGVDVSFNRRLHNEKVVDRAWVPIHITATEDNFPEAVEAFNIRVDTTVMDTVNALWRNAGRMYSTHSVTGIVHFSGDENVEGMSIGITAHILREDQMWHFVQEMKEKGEVGFRKIFDYSLARVTCDYIILGFITSDRPTAYDKARGVPQQN